MSINAKLSSVFEIITTGKQKNTFNINLEGLYPLISASTANNGIMGYVDNYLYDGQNITISRVGNAGTTFYHEGKISLTDNCFILSRINKKIAKVKYVFYLLKLNEDKKIRSISHGTTRKIINKTDLDNLIIYLPSIEIQNAIISIIEPHEKLFVKYSNLVDISSVENAKKDVDNLISIIEPIEKSIKTINLLQTKIGLFIEKTFNFINDNLVNSDLIEFSLKDLLNIKRGLPITAKDLLNNPGSYPLISASSKNNGIFGYFNDYMYDGQNITISMNGNAGCIFYQIGKFSANSDVLVLSNSNKNLTNIDYIYYLLKTKEKEIQNLAIGTTRFRLGNSVIEKFKVLLPNIEIQEKFSKIVEPLLNLSTKANKIEKNLNECLLKIVKKLIV